MDREGRKTFYRVGDLSLNAATHEVRRGRASIELPLLSYRLFLLLVRRAPAVVTHEEIVEEVWSGRIVAPGTLTQRIKLLREALNDDAQAPRYIGLVRGEGYRLIASVESSELPPTNDIRDGGVFARLPHRKYALAVIGAVAAGLALRAFMFGSVDADDPAVQASDAAAGSAAPEQAVELPFDSPGSNRRPPDPAAYRQYMAGKHFFDRRGDGDLQRAETNFLAALDIDDKLAEAWVGLAGVYYVRLWDEESIGYQTSIDLQRRALERALAIDPNLIEAHVRLSNLYWQLGDPEKAEAHLALLEKHGTDNPLVLARRAGAAARRGDLSESANLYRAAANGDPLARAYRYNLAVSLLAGGQVDEAEAEFERLESEISPSNDDYKWNLAAIQILRGNYEEALGLIEDSTIQTDKLAIRAMATAGLDRYGESGAMLAQLLAMQSAVAVIRAAEVKALIGESDAAWFALSRLEDLQPVDLESLLEFDNAVDHLTYSPFLRVNDNRHEEYRQRLVEVRSAMIPPPRG